ncbi:MAG: FtsX-like permease family protein [Demequina sp.]|uniref:FtsX-like permease family protein n=1 Tax=Demequina sp. TaxID=2050685 RepID=UPI003A8AAE39
MITGPMRWAAGVVLALGAGFGAWMAGPVWAPLGTFDDGTGPAWLPWLMALFFYGIPGLVIVGILATLFLRLGLVSARDGLATRMALGATRRDILRTAAVASARDGAIAAAVGVPVGLALAQAASDLSPMSSQELPGDPSLQWGAVAWAVAVFAGFAVLAGLCGVLAYAALTKGTPDAMARAVAGDTDVAAPSLPPRAWHRVARAVPVVASVLGFALVILNRTVPLDSWASENLESPGDLVVAKNIGLMVAAVAAVWCAFQLLRWASERAVRTASAVLGRGDATGGRAFAADGLARPSATRRRVLTVTAIVATLWAWSWGASGASEADIEAALSVDAAAIVTSVDPWAESGLPTGLSRIGLDQDVIATLADDPRLRVIPARVLVGAPQTVTLSDGTRDLGEVATAELVLAVDQADADAVAPHAYRTMGLASGVLLGGRDEEYLPGEDFVPRAPTGVGTITTWAGHTPVFGLDSEAPITTVDGEWARDIWGEAPVSSLVVLSAGAPNQEFGMPSPDVVAAVEAAVPDGRGFVLSAATDSGWLVLPSHGFAVVLGSIGAAVVVLLAAGVAHASATSRRRDLATFAALGATPRSLRAAPTWEVVVTVGSAAGIGTLLGVGLALAFSNPFLLAPGAPFDAGEIGWHLAHGLTTVPWLVVIGACVVAVSAAALVAGWAGRSMASGTPVEELREAQRAGAR